MSEPTQTTNPDDAPEPPCDDPECAICTAGPDAEREQAKMRAMKCGATAQEIMGDV
jgi:hypothetical protein